MSLEKNGKYALTNDGKCVMFMLKLIKNKENESIIGSRLGGRNMFNDFDKEEMMDDNNGFYLYKIAQEVPISADRIRRYIGYIVEDINKQNKVIKKYEEQGKDTTNLVAYRDYALYVLGLGEKPERRAKVIL